MSRYLIQVTTSPQANAAVIQNPQNRADSVRPVFEAAGGKLEEYYVALGENTIYMLADIPTEESLGTIMLATMAGGAVTSIKSTAVMTAAEAVGVMKNAGSLGYRPPSS